ncbi:MAG TPA: BREX-1 system adenine-specific DNA-methyltransferase PglX [Candidatus Dormibacteraeota bacterium]
MDRAARNTIERATQRARRLLEEDFASQLEGADDLLAGGGISSVGGAHLPADEGARRATIGAAVERKRDGGLGPAEAVADYLRDAVFTTFNQFVALKMLEARGLVQQCLGRGEQSSGYAEFTGLAPGLALLPDGRGYRLYLESLFDELSTEVRILFDRRDPASALWPRRAAFAELLEVINAPDLAPVWGDDETMGWIYQFFDGAGEWNRMREESRVPRNGRELAVRNQFFTPPYVVRFLTDNTLGRTWVEMYGEGTRLAETCEYLVRPVDEPIGARRYKDPRDLRILDPACGSGHFLLYAFDLLLTIYEEAWAIDDGAPASQLTGRTLRQDYPELAWLRRAAPGQIVEHNLYGVDVDARCIQIAALAVWLRAQRAYRDLGIRLDARPRIERSHIAVAGPMAGGADLAAAFAGELEKPFERTLFERMVQEMRLAGELGTLLQVERSLADDLSSALRQFVAEEQAVFQDAGESILEALRRFADSAAGADASRRLFAGDAARGMALIDLARTRFDVVLVNPPFGAASLVAKREFEKSYPRTKHDMDAAFVERGIQLLHLGGMLGAITSRTGFFDAGFQRWREEILLREAPPVVFADLGDGVMDAPMVESAAYCLRKSRSTGGEKTVFLRLVEADDKAAAMRAAAARGGVTPDPTRFEVDSPMFSAVPRSPFAYWAGDGLRRAYRLLPPFESHGRTAKLGLAIGDDLRFVRSAWEVRPGDRWHPLATGGSLGPYYADVPLLVGWRRSGAELEAWAGSRSSESHRSRILENTRLPRRPGLTWSRRAQGGLSFRAMPEGCAFGDDGPAAFVEADDAGELLGLLAVVNTETSRALVDLQMASGSYEVGDIQRTPVPVLAPANRAALAALARCAWSLRRGLDSRTETSRAFVLPALLHVEGESLAARSAAWSQHVRTVEAELAATQAGIDERCRALYGIEEVDRAITDGIAGDTGRSDKEDDQPPLTPRQMRGGGDDEPEGDARAGAETGVDARALAAELVSWAVGAAFGRFDVRLATGDRAPPVQPEPFDPLPACPPAILTGDDGLPLTRPPAGYPLSFPDDGILVDDPGHSRDLTTAVRAVFETVLGPRADALWREAAALLDPEGHDLRRWLASAFFEHHLSSHSRSRRRAPILWQLGIPSGRYSVWCYAHRLTRDSLFAVRSDVVAPKLAGEERRLASLVTGAGDRAAVAAQEAVVDELRTFTEELKRAAPLWNPDLDDGIVLVMAPLWRLVPTHRTWQRELRARWDRLVAGRCDWAQLAMRLWPERVVPECATDRSLAIAHGLEDVFWVEGAGGRRDPRATPTRPVGDLVAERTSSAVKAALAGFLEAPEPAAGRRRRRARATA